MLTVCEVLDPADGGGALVDGGRGGAGHPVFDGGPGRQQDVVLVHAHHVGAFGAEDPDHLEGDVLHPHFLAQGGLALEKLPDQPSGPSRQTLLALRTSRSVKAFALGQVPFPDIEKGGGGAVNKGGDPVAVAINDLGPGPDDGRRGSTAGHSLRMASPSWGVRVMTLPAPKLTPPLEAVPGRTSRLLAPMLAMVCWMAVEEPCPISIMAMTAATPMMMPRVVRAARRTLRRRPFSAVRSIHWSRSQASPERRPAALALRPVASAFLADRGPLPRGVLRLHHVPS